MNYRKLRVAWSVGWGVLCVMLIALLVWSIYAPISIILSQQPGQPTNVMRLRVYGGLIAIRDEQHFAQGALSAMQAKEIGLPVLATVVIALILLVAPWLPCRFSLRTLLIAATLIAVGLGLAVMMLRGS